MEYSEEYKRELEKDYKFLTDLYKEVLKRAGDGPYNKEEQMIIKDYQDVCVEYEEVFRDKPHFKIPAFEKLYKKRELPASKRKPTYCNNYTCNLRNPNLDEYIRVQGGGSDGRK